MKKFIGKLMLYAALTIAGLCGIIAAVQQLPPQFSDTYDAAAIDKYELLMNTESPKMIMIAGSNFAFGLDSKRISEEFRMPVVNLGLHAGIKPHFTLEMAKKNIKAGDIIVIGLEYGEYYPREIDVPTALTTVENYKELWEFISFTDYPRIFQGYISNYGILKIDRYLHGAEPAQGVYARASFNSYGDIEYARPQNLRTPADIRPDVTLEAEEISDHVIGEMNQFYEYAREQGAQVYLTYPSLDKLAVMTDDRHRQEFALALSEKIDFPIISDMETYIMDTELFYNSDYHLNDRGREIRTQNLIEDLKKVIK